MKDISQKEYIKYYLLGGLKIIPCVSNDKRPIISGWKEKATTDKQVINNWWDKYPDANIGLPTGKDNNLVVVDVDVKNDAGGMGSLKQLEDECGKFDTLMVHSPSGGRHYYFKYPEHEEYIKGPVNFRPGIDIRADGNLIIAPGSSIDGNPYEFEDEDAQIAELPQKLLEILTSDNTIHKSNYVSDFTSPISEVIYGVEKGGRNDSIFKFASRLRGIDMPYEEAINQVVVAARNCTPALSESEAIRCLDSAWKYEPNKLDTEKHLTELGNAKRLVEQYGDDIRYVTEFKKWLYWDGMRWCFDEDGHTYRLTKDTVLSIYEEAAKESDMNRRQNISQHAIKSESRYAIDAAVKLAETEAGVPISQSQLDQDHLLLGVNNGVIDLRTGGLLLNNKKDFITQKAFVDYMPQAKCPLWMSFLEQVTNNDQDLIDYLKMIVGYSLTGNTSEEILFFFHGFGSNGKGVFIDTIETLMGDYAKKTSVATLMSKGKTGADDNLARLRGSRYVTTTETEEYTRFNESLLKTLTGEDIITARKLYGNTFQYKPSFKLWIVGNHKPFIKGDDYGIWRRIKLIPFEVRISKEKRDRKLREKLKSELSGILNWAIEGCIQWQEKGLITPQRVEDATNEYRSDMDIIKSWMDDCCDPKATAYSESTARELYDSFRQWSQDNGERYVMNQRQFSMKLQEHGFEKKHTRNGSVYLGILLGNGLAYADCEF